MMFRTTPGEPESVDIVFLDDQGIDLAPAAQRKLERVLQRQEFRRAFPGEIGDLSFPPRAVESYVQDLMGAIDLRGVEDAQLKVVVDCAGGVAAMVLPTLLSRIGVEVLVVNGRLNDHHPTETRASRRTGLRKLGALVGSSGADFGVRYDPIGERIRLVDETGAAFGDQRALLVYLDLIAAEVADARVALPVTTTRVAEQVCRFHGASVTWVATTPDDLVRAIAAEAASLFPRPAPPLMATQPFCGC
jgi:mannose-1-phosphate guanylyltransferase/phosphomannomutase